MASPRVLVVDSDRSSLGLLTHGMSRFGLTPSGVADLEQARALLASERPDVVVSEVGGGPGLKVLEELRRNPATREIPVVLLAKGAWARRRAHARELGAQELIAKPAYVQDIAVLTWLYAGRDASNDLFEGTFGEPSCAALLRGLLAGGRTGTLRLEPFGAVVRFREGAVVDASLPPLVGERALMRILTLGTGSYELTFSPLDTQPTMQFELADLAGRGLSHVHDWQQVQSQLEPLEQVLTVDYGSLSTQLSDLPAGLWSLLRLFDGRRTVAEVIEDSALDDLTTGRAIAKLKTLQLFEQQRTPPILERRPEHRGPSLPASPWQGEGRALELSSAAEAYQYPPRVPEDAAPELSADSAAAVETPFADVHSGIERSFFDSPIEEASAEGARERGTRSGGLRIAGWGLVAVVLVICGISLWKGTPGAEPVAPAAAPAAQAVQPQAQAVQPAQAQPVQAPPSPAAPTQTPQMAAQAAPSAAAPAEAAVAAPSGTPPEVAAVPAPTPAEPAAAAPATEGQAPAVAAPPTGAANDLLAEGQKAYDKGRFAKAMTLFDQANGIAPNDPAVQLARGLTFYELGDLDHAGASLTRVLELDPKNARAELMLGAIAQERHDPGVARQHYKKYLELDPQGEHAAETQKLLSRLGE